MVLAICYQVNCMKFVICTTTLIIKNTFAHFMRILVNFSQGQLKFKILGTKFMKVLFTKSLYLVSCMSMTIKKGREKHKIT